MNKFLTQLATVLFLSNALCAQQNNSQSYQWPTDALVAKKLDHWRDQKFGIIIHWGIYAVPGIIESWSICSEPWIERDSLSSYGAYKKWYWDLNKQFNPVKFDPEQWAGIAKKAGMKYLVFTTKHHDGFAMFDTKESDYSIAKGPFSNNPKKDVARFVFDAFRQQGFMIGAYFSKPDWHSENYWWPKYATPDRNNNYDIRKYPWRWEKYRKFTFNQIQELMNNYGKVDILWLDGGWVRPRETVNKEVLSWGAPIPGWSQDVDIPAIAKMARAAQPGLLMVDRTVHGMYENYETPEQRIPEKQLDYPWESCLTLGNAWGFVKNDKYKSAGQVIEKLIEIVAKGGSLLLGIGPDAEGLIPAGAIEKLELIGNWMKENGEAIYNTRNAKKYHDGNTWFTQGKDGKTMYALCILKGKQAKTISWKMNLPKPGTEIRLLHTDQKVNWRTADNTVYIDLPQLTNETALAFSFFIQ